MGSGLFASGDRRLRTTSGASFASRPGGAGELRVGDQVDWVRCASESAEVQGSMGEVSERM
jgi:hypothetical protein